MIKIYLLNNFLLYFNFNIDFLLEYRYTHTTYNKSKFVFNKIHFQYLFYLLLLNLVKNIYNYIHMLIQERSKKNSLTHYFLN